MEFVSAWRNKLLEDRDKTNTGEAVEGATAGEGDGFGERRFCWMKPEGGKVISGWVGPGVLMPGVKVDPGPGPAASVFSLVGLPQRFQQRYTVTVVMTHKYVTPKKYHRDVGHRFLVQSH